MSEANGIALAQKILGARELPGESDPETPNYQHVDEDPFAPSPTASSPTSPHVKHEHNYDADGSGSRFPSDVRSRQAKLQEEANAKIQQILKEEEEERKVAEERRRTAVAEAAREPVMATKDIHGFDKGTDIFFLSNFAPSPVYINFHGVVIMLPTGEHVFQAMKAAAMLDRSPQAQIAYVVAMSKAPTPGKAKYLGRSVRIDPKRWDAMAINCMKRTVELKFSQNPELRKALLATGKVKLVEENNWGDKLWGTVNGEGRNELGKILMSYRDSIKRY